MTEEQQHKRLSKIQENNPITRHDQELAGKVAIWNWDIIIFKIIFNKLFLQLDVSYK